MAFHVYVEGPEDRSPSGIQRLAQAISQRYGLPAPDLVTRLTAGRFRVKANVDRPTAETYMRALQEVGARVTIEAASARTQPSTPPANARSGALSLPPQNARATTPPAGVASDRSGPTTPPASVPRSGPTTPPAGVPRSGPTTPPAGAVRPSASVLPPRTGASSLPPQNASRAAPSMASGLAAAFSQEIPVDQGDFGALSDGALSLSSLDGDDAGPASNAQFAPPPEPVAAIITAPSAPAKAKPADVPLDLFAPPDAEEADAKVELATDEIEHRAKRMSTPPAGVPESASASSTPAMRRSSPALASPRNDPSIQSRATQGEMPRGRFAAGVLLSILLGFVPAHFIASAREASAFQAIDTAIVTTQQGALDDEDAYRALDGFRDAQLAKKKATRRTIALQSFGIWAVVGALAAYVYFRRMPWDKRAA